MKGNWTEVQWVVQECVCPSKESLVLLILNNYISHQNLDALNLVGASGVVILSVPPHRTHKLRPFNVNVYNLFKTAFERAEDMYQKIFMLEEE